MIDIIELLKTRPLTVGEIARRLGVNYGAAQWYVYKLERAGAVYTIKIGRKRYVALSQFRVRDLLELLKKELQEAGVDENDTLGEFFQKAPHLAELLLYVARRR